MSASLIDKIKQLGFDSRLPILGKNERFSRAVIRQSRSFLNDRVNPRGVPFDIAVVGSVGRLEASPQSDFDYLIIAHGLPENIKTSRELIKATEELIPKVQLRPPGRTRMFGRVVSAPDLTEFIGLEDDTNRSLSHRILMLGESVSVYQPRLHNKLILQIFSRYLSDYKSIKLGVPRFLLNDALRYWRTLAVDYQAKRWDPQDSEKWGLRYLKLLISRKLAYAGFLAPLLTCKKATVSYFVTSFRSPPLLRLAQLIKLDLKLKEPLQRVLDIAEHFAGSLENEEFRDEANTVEHPGDKSKWPRNFSKMAKVAKDLQSTLEQIFFRSKALCKESQRYLSF